MRPLVAESCHLMARNPETRERVFVEVEVEMFFFFRSRAAVIRDFCSRRDLSLFRCKGAPSSKKLRSKARTGSCV